MYSKLSYALYQNNKNLNAHYEPDDVEQIQPFNIDIYNETDTHVQPSFLQLQPFKGVDDDDLDAQPVKVTSEINNDDIKPHSTQMDNFQSNTPYHFELNRYNNISGDDLLTREAHEEANDSANFANSKKDLLNRIFEGDDDKADQQMMEYLLKNDVKAQAVLEERKPAKRLDIKKIPIEDANILLASEPTYKSTKGKRKVANLKKYLIEKDSIKSNVEEIINDPITMYDEDAQKVINKVLKKGRRKAAKKESKRQKKLDKLIDEDIKNELTNFYENEASKTIQKVARGRQARRRLENQEKALKDQKGLTIRELQNRNNKQTRAKENDKLLQLKVQEQNQMLGEDMKSRQMREKVKQQKETEMMGDEDLPLQSKNKASTIISKFERGRQARKEAQRLKEENAKGVLRRALQKQLLPKRLKTQADKGRKRREVMDMYLGKEPQNIVSAEPYEEVIKQIPNEEVKEQELKAIEDEIGSKADIYEQKIQTLETIWDKQGAKIDDYLKSKSTKYKFDELWNTYKYMLYKQGKSQEIMKIQAQIDREEKGARRNKKITREFLIAGIVDEL